MIKYLKHLYIALTALLLSGLSACNGGAGSHVEDTAADDADTLTYHAHLLNLVRHPGGLTVAEILDPWSEGRYLGRYALVHRDSVLPENLPGDMNVIRTPVEKAAVFSAVHTAAMEELGAIDRLAAVADASFFSPADTVSALVKSGRVADVGQSTLPSAERLAASGAEILMRSPMEGAAAVQLPSSLVPVEMADYLETSPIARAEWILLLGELFGKTEEARDVFTQVIEDYNSLVLKASASATAKPTVLTETETSGVWYVPAGQSYQARMLADAGAVYPWADTEGTGSLALSLENVAGKALDADLWLVRSYGYETTPASLLKLNPRYNAFKPFKEGNIYSCNSAERLIFNDIAFHPEKVLADYVAIFHPDAMPGYELKYFKRTGK